MTDTKTETLPAVAMPCRCRCTMSITELTGQAGLIQSAMKGAMKEGEHFGVIPGTSKPTLLQPGAEKLILLFRLSPRYTLQTSDLGGGHREHVVQCALYGPDDNLLAEGLGSASTMESKYRYRKQNGARVENEDLADTWNTVLKIARKRAMVDAVKTATAASDIFTQDVEDMDRQQGQGAPQAQQESPQGAGNGQGATSRGKGLCPDCGAEAVIREQIRRVGVLEGRGWLRPEVAAQPRDRQRPR